MDLAMHALTSSLPDWSGALFASLGKMPPWALLPIARCAALAALPSLARRTATRRRASTEDPGATRT